MKTIWCLFSQPESDCHRNDFRAWWQEKPDAVQLMESFEHFFMSDPLPRNIADMILSGSEANFEEYYWTLKRSAEGVWQ